MAQRRQSASRRPIFSSPSLPTKGNCVRQHARRRHLSAAHSRTAAPPPRSTPARRAKKRALGHAGAPTAPATRRAPPRSRSALCGVGTQIQLPRRRAARFRVAVIVRGAPQMPVAAQPPTLHPRHARGEPCTGNAGAATTPSTRRAPLLPPRSRSTPCGAGGAERRFNRTVAEPRGAERRCPCGCQSLRSRTPSALDAPAASQPPTAPAPPPPPAPAALRRDRRHAVLSEGEEIAPSVSVSAAARCSCGARTCGAAGGGSVTAVASPRVAEAEAEAARRRGRGCEGTVIVRPVLCDLWEEGFCAVGEMVEHVKMVHFGRGKAYVPFMYGC